MSPESIISVLSRLRELIELREEAYKSKLKRFKQQQMMLFVISLSVCIVLFFVYAASIVQMMFVLSGFNLLFFLGFKPRSFYNKKNSEIFQQHIFDLQSKLSAFLRGEEVSFDGQRCSVDEEWNFDKWGLYKDTKRIDYGEFLYDRQIKGLYLQALKNKR